MVFVEDYAATGLISRGCDTKVIDSASTEWLSGASSLTSSCPSRASKLSDWWPRDFFIFEDLGKSSHIDIIITETALKGSSEAFHASSYY